MPLQGLTPAYRVQEIPGTRLATLSIALDPTYKSIVLAVSNLDDKSKILRVALRKTFPSMLRVMRS